MSRWLRAAGVSTEVQKGQFRQKGQKPPIGDETRLLSPSVLFVPFVLTSKGLTPDQLDAIEERAAIIHEAHIHTIADDGTRLPAPIFEISQERAKRMAWAEVERRARNEQ